MDAFRVDFHLGGIGFINVLSVSNGGGRGKIGKKFLKIDVDIRFDKENNKLFREGGIHSLNNVEIIR